jgi:hypothetical protein
MFKIRYPNNLLPASLFALISKLFCVFMATTIGKIVDTYPRLNVVTISLIFQNVSVAICGVLIFILSYFFKQMNSPFSNTITTTIFILCVFFGGKLLFMKY